MTSGADIGVVLHRSIDGCTYRDSMQQCGMSNGFSPLSHISFSHPQPGTSLISITQTVQREPASVSHCIVPYCSIWPSDRQRACASPGKVGPETPKDGQPIPAAFPEVPSGHPGYSAVRLFVGFIRQTTWWLRTGNPVMTQNMAWSFRIAFGPPVSPWQGAPLLA
ncbi:hypothetical protein N658DRAFT_183981 [Parathielavia hyrcaniae]|uniref:Uncharacterized protein n=1 Tax=Parathielavia hyrcaniae TaxID=113614 RepID=A0AAN6T498_9PEZI|nr:hypothetical protein N658DRAFT_183981 [Parathielavia hyrcaniae]